MPTFGFVLDLGGRFGRFQRGEVKMNPTGASIGGDLPQEGFQHQWLSQKSDPWRQKPAQPTVSSFDGKPGITKPKSRPLLGGGGEVRLGTRMEPSV